MQTQSRRQAARASRSTRADLTLSIRDIEGAFARAGLISDYQTLVQALGAIVLAQSMTQRWLDLTIQDLLASKGTPVGAQKTRAPRRQRAGLAQAAPSGRAHSAAH